jgi:hypothetical protein
LVLIKLPDLQYILELALHGPVIQRQPAWRTG